MKNKVSIVRGLFMSIAFLLLLSCDKGKNCHKTIRFKNNSTQGVVTLKDKDTMIKERDIFLGYDPSSLLIPPDNKQSNWSSKINSGNYGDCFESYFHEKGVGFIGDTIRIFVFSYDTLMKYDWEVIRSGYKILKRYDLTLKNLKDLNWSITYPPSEFMKDIKQFPPY